MESKIKLEVCEKGEKVNELIRMIRLEKMKITSNNKKPIRVNKIKKT